MDIWSETTTKSHDFNKEMHFGVKIGLGWWQCCVFCFQLWFVVSLFFCLPFGTICILFVYFGTPFSSIFNEKIRIKEGERVLIKKIYEYWSNIVCEILRVNPLPSIMMMASIFVNGFILDNGFQLQCHVSTMKAFNFHLLFFWS